MVAARCGGKLWIILWRWCCLSTISANNDKWLRDVNNSGVWRRVKVSERETSSLDIVPNDMGRNENIDFNGIDGS